MVKPIRLRLSRAPGFNLQAHSLAANGLPARSVARPGQFGNRWRCIARHAGCPDAPGYNGPPGLRCCVAQFREWLLFGIEVHACRKADWTIPGMAGALVAKRLPELRGHNLACWCPLPAPGEPDRCHAAVLLELANA